jgi:hypothetical protein
LQIAGAVLVHPSGQAAQGAFSGLQVIAQRRFSGLLGVGCGQDPVKQVIDDFLAGDGESGASQKARSSRLSSPAR